MNVPEEIIKEIKNNLPQDSYGDQVRYLQRKINEYSEHPDFKTIEKECNRLIGELMPEEKKAAVLDKIASEINNVKVQLKSADDLIRRGDYASAYEITMSLSELADRRPIIEDDGESAYYNFSEDFERVIYLEIECQNGRDTAERLKETDFPYYGVYALNGTCLIEAGKYREAAAEFKKDSYWNPASAYARFQYVAALFKMGVDKNTWSLSIDNMKYLFRRYDISQCYYHLALSYDAGKCFEAAIACLLLSNSYYLNKDREEYMKAIMKETNLLPSHFTTERMQELAREYRFPLEPEKAVVNLAYENGMNVINSDPQLAVYYLKIASDLAESDEIRNGLIMAQKLTEEQTAGKHGDNDI